MKTFKPRHGWAAGDRIETTPRYLSLYPRGNARGGYILNFGPGTMLTVKFDDHRHYCQIDERFIRKVEA